MKILEPIESGPGREHRSKYTEIYDAASRLVNGSALPVECETRGEAVALCLNIRNSHKPRKLFLASIRGNTVFVSKRTNV